MDNNPALASLLKVQQTLKATKDKRNDFGKYNYRSAESIFEAAKPLCHDNGLVLTCSDRMCIVGERYYVEATAKVIDTVTGSEVSATAYAKEDESKKGMDGAQLTGSCSSYARKYALCGLFAIDDNKDADTNEYHAQTTEKQKQNTKSDDSAKRIWAKANEYHMEESDLDKIASEIYKVPSFKKLSVNQAKHLADNFDRVLDQYAAS